MAVYIGAISGSKVTIEKINYFGQETDSEEWNAKVLYRKGNKGYYAIIYIDYFNRRVYIPKQPKGAKALVGLQQALDKELNFK